MATHHATEGISSQVEHSLAVLSVRIISSFSLRMHINVVEFASKSSNVKHRDALQTVHRIN